MAAVASPVEWQTCSHTPNCLGVEIPKGGGACLAHAGPAARDLAFTRIARDRQLDARGVVFSAELWEQVADHLRGAAPLAELRLDRAELPAGVSLSNLEVEGESSFDGASFGADTDLSSVRFRAPAWFREVVFAGAVDFTLCEFEGGVEFRAAEFGGDASFWQVRFRRGPSQLGGARFHGAVFKGDVDFRDAIFDARAGFRDVRFLGTARFGPLVEVKTSRPQGPARFAGYTSFDGAQFTQHAAFPRVSFEQSPSFDAATFGWPEQAHDAPGSAMANFETAAFPAGARFDRTRFCARSTFAFSEFGGPVQFGEAVFENTANWRSARFDRVSFHNARFVGDAQFQAARFTHEANFDSARFVAEATFDDAVFEDASRFADARFEGDASFLAADFAGPASFGGAQFGDRACFGESTEEAAGYAAATFREAAMFTSASFDGHAGFMGVGFGGEAGFSLATLAGGTAFRDARFAGRATFDAARFSAEFDARGALFDDDADFVQARLSTSETRFEQARFRAAARFDDADVDTSMLALDGATFAQRLILQLYAEQLLLRRTQFAGGLVLRADSDAIVIEDAEFGQPSTIATRAGATSRARVVSLRGSDVGKLALADVDLGACRFDGVHNLSGLRIEGTEVFERTPAGYRGTRRQAIAEEHEWRRDHPRPLQSKGWYPPACAFPDSLRPRPDALEPHEISAIYRDLRKGREDNKDAPGAADFYYGEMEMRRHSGPPTPLAERLIVTGYWAVSGYGLRASRSLAWLSVLVCVFAVLFWQFGFESGSAEPSFTRALLFSLESTTSLLRGMDRELTTVGEAMWIALRITGPLLFGLAVLSLRGRVKR